MPGSNGDFLKTFVYRLAECSCSEQRWAVMKETLGDLGASSVIAAKVQKSSGIIDWMQSSLPETVIFDYLSEGFMNHDLIARHAASKPRDLVWRPRDGWNAEGENDSAGFAGFVAESGFQSIVSSSISDSSGYSRYAITYCSEYSSNRVLSDEGKARILQSCKIFLPWLSWQGIKSAKDFTHANKRTLSPRERDVLCYLASGLQNGQISGALGISDTMVSKHIFHAREKLGAQTAAQAVAIAIREGQINL
ncbi:response regulator transcription factor [Leisingera caerulea]|uniref:Helix-turn-helix transcriptional regulator n=1 Tax=Leisingera caerulea TaxID=506591 RepID=A0A9Q9HDC1_LEICA|nr:helix-turn-helix transcriptional regulator [Leisingera caerulea]UWQ53038.1 helix-turn-helix transcriptional regulator [Leisingera caerulea]